MILTKKQRYMKKLYQDNKGTMDGNSRRSRVKHPGLHRKPTPILKQKMTRTRCIGPLCWREGLTFMSPDPIRVRRCDRCIAYTEGRSA